MQMLVVEVAFTNTAFKQNILPNRVFNNGVLGWPAVCQTSLPLPAVINSFSLVAGQGS